MSGRTTNGQEAPQAFAIALAALSLAAFTALTVAGIVSSSPVYDETAHLASGYTYLRFRDYRLNPEHPPLIKMLAAAPLLTMDVWPPSLEEARGGTRTLTLLRESWTTALTEIPSQWRFSELFLYGLRDSALARTGAASPLDAPTTSVYARSDFLNDSERMLIRARLVVLAFGLLTGALIFLWSYETWGAWGAALSTALFAFDPSFIAHSGLVTTDAGVTALMLAAIYFFWRTCTHRTAGNAVAFAIAFALAQTAKFTAVLLVPTAIVLAVYTILRARDRGHAARNLAIALAAACIASFIAIWAVFGFRYSAAAAGTGHFDVREAAGEWSARKLLAAQAPDGFTPADVARVRSGIRPGLLQRFAIEANELHLLPEAYLEGFAIAGGSTVGRLSFLNGEESITGFDSYFFWTFLYKTPLPAIAIMLAGFYVAMRTRKWETIFLLWPVTIYLIVALTSSLNIGHRHIMVVFPFICVLCGALASRRAAVAVGATIVLAISANVVFAGRPAPMIGKHLSYMNEIAGGPRRGYLKLNDSNFDWGQDLGRLAEWVRANRIEEPIGLVYFGTADPRFYGLRYNDLRDFPPQALERGHLAISTFDYAGLGPAGSWWRSELQRRNAQLAGTAGYSILIFRID